MLRLSMLFFGCHEKKKSWSKSVSANGFGTQQGQTKRKNGSSQTKVNLESIHIIHTQSRHRCYDWWLITKTPTSSPAPVASRELLAPHRPEVGSSVPSSPDTCSGAVQAPFHQHILRKGWSFKAAFSKSKILSACPSTSKSKVLTLHPRHAGKETIL
jgi:hypothetical protein